MNSYAPGGFTIALAVPFDNPQPDIVDEMVTEKEADTSSTNTLATFVHDVPGFDTVTLYDPAANPEIVELLCPLDHAYVYVPDGLTKTVAVPSDPPQVDWVVVKEIVGLNGTDWICADKVFSQLPPALIVTV